MNASMFRERYGPWAVVTGASNGIGRAFASECAGRGLDIVLVARHSDVLEEFKLQLTTLHGVQALAIAADLGTPEGLDTLSRKTADLDVGLLIAAAGYGTSGPFLDGEITTEQDMLNVNCLAVLHSAYCFGRRFRQRGRGGLILLSSLVGWQGTPQSAHYAATKAYVQALAEGIQIELSPLNIDVLAVAPGPVHSGFAQRADMRMGAAVSPEVVAKASLRAMGRKGTVIPGVLSKVLTWSLLPLPRSVRSQILGRVMSGMTRHQHKPELV